MLCSSCQKLAILPSNRKCIRCSGIILNNISVICDNCSTGEKMCSICLKKIYDQNRKEKARGNCRFCGKKK